MYFKKVYIWVLFGALLMSVQAFAQKSKDRHNRNPMRISRSKAKIVCPVFENNRYPYQGLGFKLGDPFALTYKFYLNEHFGIVADFGKASSGLYSRYFREAFAEYVDEDTLSGESSVDYLTHKVKTDWVAELKFLWHFDAKGITPGLRVYIGFGPEVKLTKLEYQYFYNSDPSSSGFNTLGQFTRNRYTFGPQATVGIEYSYFQIPISAFMELELFNDISLDPGRRRFEGGAGLRYIF